MYNIYSLGPAPSSCTDHIYELSTKISEYHIANDLKVEIDAIGTQSFTVDGHSFQVQILDSVQDYLDYMKEIFDFKAIKDLLTGTNGQTKLKITANALHGGRVVTDKSDFYRNFVMNILNKYYHTNRRYFT